MTDHGLAAQQAAEAHMEACWIAFYAEQDENVEPQWPEDMAGPFCGCETCVVRETLHAAWPHLRQAALEGAE